MRLGTAGSDPLIFARREIRGSEQEARRFSCVIHALKAEFVCYYQHCNWISGLALYQNVSK